MRHIKLDHENSQIREFILSLAIDPDGSILEFNGEPLLRLLPIGDEQQAVDKVKLKAAILRRRDESRQLNEEWAAVDHETWEQSPDSD